ncbi:MAG: phosphotyrosine protein phosphatase [Candidatus Riflebacteria bacterium]|nr:phosphotyrosine protein phosphatase [Candidatus Riflebacteria bacterium]
MKKVLFICSQNKFRSPTAERIFSNLPDFEVSSAGINNDAANPLSSEDLEEADYIFVMEKIQRNKIQKKFKEHLKNKKIVCLDIPDEYEYMDPALVKLLKSKLDKFFEGK